MCVLIMYLVPDTLFCYHVYFPAQLAGGFTLCGGFVDEPLASSFQQCIFFRAEGSAFIPTARQIASKFGTNLFPLHHVHLPCSAMHGR